MIKLKKKTSEKLIAENRLLRSHNFSESVANVLNNLIRWAGLCFISLMVFLSIQCLAGKVTIADFGLKIIANKYLSQIMSIVFGSGGVVYGVSQRKLRRDATERQEGRIKELESFINPDRGSSQLTKRGTTPSEDKLK